jgi:2-amino-4-hydroxy-6-hydroxymethyldihydropteridine diphosphokinase
MITMHQACLLLGSNIEPEQNLPRAVSLLLERVTVYKKSSVWETASVDCCYPNYLNLALLIATDQDADQLKEGLLRPLEAQMGRLRTQDKNASRTIDFDIILFDGKLQDPDLWKHAHLAVPVAEIFPHLRSDLGGLLIDRAHHLAQSTPILIREDVQITLPEK